jgi:hypothetical protein
MVMLQEEFSRMSAIFGQKSREIKLARALIKKNRKLKTIYATFAPA